MTSNPFIKRLLGEAAPAVPEEDMPEVELAEPQPEGQPEQEPQPQQQQQQEPPPQQQQQEPAMQGLVQQWQSGDHMAVAAKLMFTDASYTDFVDLAFTLGREDAHELAELLDELAETGAIEPPEAPPQYRDLLGRTGGEEEGVL